MRVAFLVCDFEGDAGTVTKALGVDPTEVHERGERMGPGARRVESSVWRLESPLESLGLDEHLDWLLERLPADLLALESWAPGWTVQLAVAIHIWGADGPATAVTESHVRRLAKLNASIDIDIYCRD
jgi:hypothetical protein